MTDIHHAGCQILGPWTLDRRGRTWDWIPGHGKYMIWQRPWCWVKRSGTFIVKIQVSCFMIQTSDNRKIYKWRLFKVASNKVSTKVKAISFAENGSYFVTAGNRWRAEFSELFKTHQWKFSFSDMSSSGIWNTLGVRNTRRLSLSWDDQPFSESRGTTTFVMWPAAKETWSVEMVNGHHQESLLWMVAFLSGQLFLAVM